ncbi:MAG TPA: DUF1697 domain-containing protein [Gaiellaceae bacterium]
MPAVVALLRAVNVGGRKVPMADLRDAVESLGFVDVRTYIQSGNVLFSAPRVPKPDALEHAIVDRFGISVDVVIRSAADLRRALERDPFPDVDHSKLHVGFMAEKPVASALSAIDRDAFLPDQFAVAGRELYLYLPNGMARTKLPGHLLRRLDVPTTIRNWNTVTKLAELARTSP